MKICYAGTAYPMRGGIAQYNAILFNLISKSNETKFFSFKRQYPEFLFPGKTQYETAEPANKVPDEKNVIIIDSINPLNWIISGLKIRKENPDILIFKYWIPFFSPCYYVISKIVKLFRKTKILYIIDNIIPHEKRFGDKMLNNIGLSISDYFIVQSRTVEKDLELFNKKKKPYIYSPHPLYDIFGKSISKREAKEFLNTKYGFEFGEEKVILFFGYIRHYKGLMTLIDAMPELIKKHNIKLLIGGEFYENEEAYLKKIRESGLEKNTFLVSDFISDDFVKYFFCASDCLVLPYYSATQSGIIQIAYHFNKPVIATNVGGLSEVLIDSETGLLIKPGSSGEIVSAVNKFYENELENTFVRNIETEKKKYSWEFFVNNLYNLIKK